MRLEVSEGAILYEMRDGGAGRPFFRSYERSVQKQEQSAREALLWQIKHKQPKCVYLILDLTSGSLSRWDENDVKGE